jgi:hypothetical protein
MDHALRLAVVLLAGLVAAAPAAAQKGTTMQKASGPFDVTITPAAEDKGDGPTLARLTLDKRYHGDLEATAKGEMLTAAGDVKGAAAYVAVERVTGTLHGRKGSFALVHRGVMSAAGQELLVTVVPDSGSGELRGLAGTLAIRFEPGGKHFYDLEYTLPER